MIKKHNKKPRTSRPRLCRFGLNIRNPVCRSSIGRNRNVSKDTHGQSVFRRASESHAEKKRLCRRSSDCTVPVEDKQNERRSFGCQMSFQTVNDDHCCHPPLSNSKFIIAFFSETCQPHVCKTISIFWIRMRRWTIIDNVSLPEKAAKPIIRRERNL